MDHGCSAQVILQDGVAVEATRKSTQLMPHFPLVLSASPQLSYFFWFRGREGHGNVTAVRFYKQAKLRLFFPELWPTV